MKRIIIVLIGIFFIVSSADAGLLLLRVRGEVIVKGLKESHPAAVREGEEFDSSHASARSKRGYS